MKMKCQNVYIYYDIHIIMSAEFSLSYQRFICTWKDPYFGTYPCFLHLGFLLLLIFYINFLSAQKITFMLPKGLKAVFLYSQQILQSEGVTHRWQQNALKAVNACVTFRPPGIYIKHISQFLKAFVRCRLCPLTRANRSPWWKCNGVQRKSPPFLISLFQFQHRNKYFFHWNFFETRIYFSLELKFQILSTFFK